MQGGCRVRKVPVVLPLLWKGCCGGFLVGLALNGYSTRSLHQATFPRKGLTVGSCSQQRKNQPVRIFWMISKTCLILRFPGWFLFRDLKPVILAVETSQIIGVSPSLITIKHVLTMVTPSMGYIPITYNQEDVSLHIWISRAHCCFFNFLDFFYQELLCCIAIL